MPLDTFHHDSTCRRASSRTVGNAKTRCTGRARFRTTHRRPVPACRRDIGLRPPRTCGDEHRCDRQTLADGTKSPHGTGWPATHLRSDEQHFVAGRRRDLHRPTNSGKPPTASVRLHGQTLFGSRRRECCKSARMIARTWPRCSEVSSPINPLTQDARRPRSHPAARLSNGKRSTASVRRHMQAQRPPFVLA